MSAENDLSSFTEGEMSVLLDLTGEEAAFLVEALGFLVHASGVEDDSVKRAEQRMASIWLLERTLTQVESQMPQTGAALRKRATHWLETPAFGEDEPATTEPTYPPRSTPPAPPRPRRRPWRRGPRTSQE